MPVTVENCVVADDKLEAAELGLQRIGAAGTTVIITPDLQSAVREHFAADDAYSTYSSDRGGGVVGAKTVTHSSGHIIFVDHTIFDAATLEDNERLLAHEGGHVIAALNGEEFIGRHHLAGTQAEYDLMGAVALAVEEYRIERELAEMGFPDGRDGHIDSMGWMLYTTSYDLLRTLLDPAAGADSGVFRSQVLATLSDFVKILGYAAGPVVARHAGVFPVTQFTPDEKADWDDYVGHLWGALANLLRPIPGIGTRMSAHEIEASLIAVTKWYETFIHRAGFTQTVDASGVEFVRTGSDDLWNERLLRIEAVVRNKGKDT